MFIGPFKDAEESDSMNSIKLDRFTWAYVQLQDEKILSPICPSHQEAHVHREPSWNDLVVLCGAPGNHLLNMCPSEEVETEKPEAPKILTTLPT
jgi:hypothetical protein